MLNKKYYLLLLILASSIKLFAQPVVTSKNFPSDGMVIKNYFCSVPDVVENNFGAQEPGTNEEIAIFCKLNYGVTFPMMSKISVKGDDMHEVYQFLTQKSKNGVKDSDVKWNFQKYLLNEKGELEEVYLSVVEPNDAKIIDWIKG